MNTKGSEWNKWDLHFHTPSSTICYKNKSITNLKIVEAANKIGIKCMAITDHHTIDIERIQELQNIATPLGITILPGIEFLGESRGKEPVHFIGIFSEKDDIKYIWDELKIKSGINSNIKSGKLVNQIYCNIEGTIKIIHDLGGIVTIHAGDKSNTIENITHSLPHHLAQKENIANSVDIFEIGSENDISDYKKIVFPAIKKNIPLIICSDNHDANQYTTKQNLWIKGSTNFEGLKYALNEPEDRFFIGKEPPLFERVKENGTKFIRTLSIKRETQKDISNQWFENIEIPLNHELVSIIGNKGSGKSAISDIISFCCDSENIDFCSFLNKNQFKKKGLADHFAAKVSFESDSESIFKNLLSTNEKTNIPRVKYLPQNYFEKVCNEISNAESLRNEIEKVVFQYIPEHEKLKKTNFKELIQHNKESIENEKQNLLNTLRNINIQISTIEDLISDKNIKATNNLISLKEEELSAHLKNKPAEVIDPDKSKNDFKTLETRGKLTLLNNKKNQAEQKINSLKKRLLDISIIENNISTIKSSIKLKLDEIRTILSESNATLSENNIDIYSFIKIEFNEELLNNIILELQKEKTNLVKDLGDTERNFDTQPIGSALFILNAINMEIEEINRSISKEQQEYGNYILELKKWNDRINEINGSTELHGSLLYLKKLIDDINTNLPSELVKLREDRLNISISIYNLKNNIKGIYDSIKRKIDDKLKETKMPDINIVSTFSITENFKETFFNGILQNKSGSFYGTEDGLKLFNSEILSTTNFNDTESLKNFLNNTILYLENDKRKGHNQKTFIGDIVKSRPDFYNYLFGLDYLFEHYSLQHNGKDIEKLSPGERGSLLLVFYLVLDKDNIPLIIDQPEDNLDNNSVAKTLVPFIKQAKKHRQIIMVTHNPNLAVVADSEQIVRVFIDKAAGNKFSFISGGIESEKIRDTIVDVLEGTMPAFNTRRKKYLTNSNG